MIVVDLQVDLWMPTLVRDTMQHHPDFLREASRRVSRTYACDIQGATAKVAASREPSTKTSRTTQVEVSEAFYHHIGDNDNE